MFFQIKTESMTIVFLENQFKYNQRVHGTPYRSQCQKLFLETQLVPFDLREVPPAIIPSDPMVFATSPGANPPVPSAPDAAQLWPSGSSTPVEAVTSVAQTATDVAAGALH